MVFNVIKHSILQTIYNTMDINVVKLDLADMQPISTYNKEFAF